MQSSSIRPTRNQPIVDKTNLKEDNGYWLDKLERLCEAAAPKPWEARDRSHGWAVVSGGCGVGWFGEMRDDNPTNAQLTAEARNALPALLAFVREARSFADKGFGGWKVEAVEDALRTLDEAMGGGA